MNNQINYPMGPTPNPYYPQNNYAPSMGAQTPFYSQPVLQPAGMVYIINSSQELNTIPTSAGLTFYWCNNENKMYIRNCVNGTIETKEFFVSTSQNNSNNAQQIVGIDAIQDIPTELFDKLDSRLSNIERQIKKLKGGEPEWQI